MPAGPTKRFDPERLAAQGDALTGTLATDSMPRLRDMLVSGDTSQVDVELRAYRDDAKRLLLEGRASANLDLACQRCMEPVTLPVDASIALAVVADEESARQLPAQLDPLLLEHGEEADLSRIVEDELILALPAVPRHANIEDCGERARYGAEAADEFDGSVRRENPFALLKTLKNRKD